MLNQRAWLCLAAFYKPFEGLVSVLSSPLLIPFGCDECRLQPKGLLQSGVEVGPVVDVKFKAVNCHIKPGLCLGVWGQNTERESELMSTCVQLRNEWYRTTLWSYIMFRLYYKHWVQVAKQSSRVDLCRYWPCCFCFGLYIFHHRNMSKPSCIL